LPKFLSQLRLDKRHPPRIPLGFVARNHRSAVGTLNKTAASFATFGPPAAFSLKRQLFLTSLPLGNPNSKFTNLYTCSYGKARKLYPATPLFLGGTKGAPQLLTLHFSLSEETKLGFWKVVTSVDANCSCRFYSAVFTTVLSPNQWSQLKERTL
jgi:hypothetical protein